MAVGGDLASLIAFEVSYRGEISQSTNAQFMPEIFMLRTVLPMLLLAALSSSAAHATNTIGFKEIELSDAQGDRPLHVSVWYPTVDIEPVEEVGEDRAFVGIPAIINAKVTDTPHPLVVLSHGYGGSWRNLNWLAGELVQQGYVVAAPDHPGTTTFDKSPAQAAMLWERPHDLGRTIDALTDDASLAGPIEPTRIAAIGHSLGGWTVAALGGARFSVERFAEACKQHADPHTCGLAAELGINAQQHEDRLEEDLSDPRIGAIVSLDLGLARGFTPESLAAVRVPALIIGSGVDIGDLPAKLESGYLAANLPDTNSRYVEISDAMHFSFMQLCKPDAIDLLEQDTPGDGIICKDGGRRDRQSIHRQVSDMILAFLTKAIPQK